MTIEVKTQTRPGPLRAPVTLRYDVKSVMIGNQPGQSSKIKTMHSYTIHQNGIEIPIREGRFKKMRKQHEDRNRWSSGTKQRVCFRQGFAVINL